MCISKKFNAFFSIAILLFAIGAFAAKPAQADTTNWISPDELTQLTKRMKREHLVPTKIECRGDSRSPSIRKSIELRMTYVPNTADKVWAWYWGIGYESARAYYRRNPGWKEVSVSGFLRPKTGLFVRCGVFQK